MCVVVFFFFKQKTAYEMRISDWSSDVCSSDLPGREAGVILVERGLERKTPGRAEEIDQHRQRAVFEIERAHVEPSRIGRAGQHRAEPRFGLAMARERRSGAPLPAARFEGEESVDPRVERLEIGRAS